MPGFYLTASVVTISPFLLPSHDPFGHYSRTGGAERLDPVFHVTLNAKPYPISGLELHKSFGTRITWIKTPSPRPPRA